MGLWDSVTGFFEDLGDFFSGKDFFECAGYAWNDMMQLASDVLTKKEVINLKKEWAKLEKNLGGIKDMKEIPDAIRAVKLIVSKMADAVIEANQGESMAEEEVVEEEVSEAVAE